MKRILSLIVMVGLCATISVAQHPHHDGHHHHHAPQNATLPETQYNADGIAMDIVAAFPTAKRVKASAKWTEVYDNNGKLLGYAAYSKPDSDGIKGFAGETPVMIAFNTKKVIIGVYLLPNLETPKFAKRVSDSGLYDSWNGLTIKQAKKKKVDSVSGATFTSKAVIMSVEKTLERL